MAERVVAVVEARMGSSRLPGKSMLPLAGAPLVERVIERVRRATRLDAVVLATSTSPGDDVLVEHARGLGVEVFRGSESDVLDRILGAARVHEATVHVEIWGDCPFLRPSEIDRCVEALLGGDWDLVGNDLGAARTVAVGLDVLAFRADALARAERETRGDAYHREHGSTYLYETGLFRCLKLDTPPEIHSPDFDATVNTAEDYDLVSRVYEKLAQDDPCFDITQVFELLRTDVQLRTHPKARGIPGPRS